MKKKLSLWLSLLVLLTMSFSHAKAGYTECCTGPETVTVYNPKTGQSEMIVASSIVVLPDGCRIAISEINEESSTRASGGIASSKNYSFYTSDHILQWRVTLQASFTFNGSNATCVSAKSRTEVFDGNWSESSNNTYASGNTAIASVTVVRKFLFIVVETQNAYLTMSCTPNGYLC